MIYHHHGLATQALVISRLSQLALKIRLLVIKAIGKNCKEEIFCLELNNKHCFRFPQSQIVLR
jgi:hypothetical protein